MANLKQIYNELDKTGFLDRTLVTIRNRDIPFLEKTKGKTSISYKNAVDTLNVGLAVRDAVRKGGDSKVPIKGLNMLGKAVSRELDMDQGPSPRIRLTGTPNNPGITATAPVGPGKGGLVLPNFKNPSSMRAFYEDPKTRIDVDRNRVSGRRNFGEFGGFTLSGEAYATKRGPDGKPEIGGMLRGRRPLAKGGKIKQYAKGGGVRKPKLK